MLVADGQRALLALPVHAHPVLHELRQLLLQVLLLEPLVVGLALALEADAVLDLALAVLLVGNDAELDDPGGRKGAEIGCDRSDHDGLGCAAVDAGKGGVLQLII